MTCLDFTHSPTLAATRLAWTCEKCLLPIDNGHGWIGVQRAEIRALRVAKAEGLPTPTVRWHAHHGGCTDPTSDVWWYRSTTEATDKHRLDKLALVVLSEQWWWPHTNWTEFTAGADA